MLMKHSSVYRAGLGCLLIALVGCGGSGGGAEVADHETLTFTYSSDCDYLDPQGTSWLKDFRIIECMYETLLRVDPNTLEIVPASAEAWTVSDDGLVYIFTIREGAKWSNGDPLRASDFVYGWKRALLPDFAADYSSLLFHVKNGKAFFEYRTKQLDEFARIRGGAGGDGKQAAADAAQAALDLTDEFFDENVGLKAIDDRTLEVTLERPTAYWPEIIAFATLSPVHEASESQYIVLDAETGKLQKDTTYFGDPDRVVGNGPYVLSDWKFKQKLTLDQNPHYWNKAEMNNKRVVQLVVPESNTALLQYEQGKVDWVASISTSDAAAADLVAAQRSDVHNPPAAGTYFYSFNCREQIDGKKNPLADPRVRRALSMGIDRKTVVEKVTRLNEPAARTFVPVDSIPGYDPPVEAGITYDPEGAKKLLAEAGYPNGQGIGKLSILYNNEGGHGRIAQAIARQWERDLGVSVTLEGVETNRFRERRNTGDFTVARGGWYGDYRDPTTFLDMWRSDDGNNDSKYVNKQFEALLDQASNELDPEKRMALLRDAEALLLQDQPLAPIHQYTLLEIFDPARVKNFILTPWSNRQIEKIALVPDAGSGL